jgi:polyisoprenoid-binding protein YceI
MKLQCAIFVLAVAAPLVASQYALTLNPESTKIHWTLSDVLHTVHGTFKLKSGEIDFDPKTGAASGQIVVDVVSGESGSEARDHRMHANVLESAKYPEAVFAPDRLEGKLALPGTSDLKLHGTFRIHGEAHEMRMDVQAKVGDDRLSGTVRFDIPYVEWGMKDPSTFLLKVSKTVQMTIESEGKLTKR